MTKRPPETAQKDREERAWKVAQLAATLATRYSMPMDNRHLTGEAFIDYQLEDGEDSLALDAFYLGLTARAETLLAMAEKRTGFVYAYQFFERGRHYTFSEMETVFTKCDWNGLTSENSIRNLVKKLVSELSELYNVQLMRLRELEKELISSKSTSPPPGAELEVHLSKNANNTAITNCESDLERLARMYITDATPQVVEANQLFWLASRYPAFRDNVAILRSKLREGFERYF